MLLAGVAACNALFGVTDYSIDGSGGGGGGGTETAGVGGTGGATACLANEVMACYDGPDDTLDVGICASGTQTCREDGAGFGDCIAAQLPMLDDCASVQDEDCNGFACGEAIWSIAVSDDALQTDRQEVVATASNDDVVVITGTYRGALRIGAHFLPGETDDDGFVAKVDTLGNVIWLVRFSGATHQRPQAIALDAAGNVFVAGRFRTQLTIGPSTTLNAVGWDAFIVKLDPDGAPVWTTTAGGDGDADVLAIDVAADGAVAVAVEVSGNVDFGIRNLTVGSANNGFASLLDASGTPVWVASEQSLNDASSNAVAIDDSRVFIGGEFSGTANVSGAAVTAVGNSDGLVIAYNRRSGNIMSYVQLSGMGSATVDAISLYQDSLIIAGEFDGPLDISDGVARTATGTDVFVARFPLTLGTPVWGRNFVGTGNEKLSGIAVDAVGEIAVVGSFDSDMEWGETSLVSAGMADVFINKLDAEGEARFATSYGDINDEMAAAISVRPTSRELFAVGTFAGDIDFGPTLHKAQSTDGFLVRVAP